jgi:hypothetical protein
MHQTRTGSSKAESYTWGCEVECFLPQGKVQELGISIGSYHHGHPLPPPFPPRIDRIARWGCRVRLGAG